MDGMPMADGSFGWQMAMACKFFGGLTIVSRLASGDGLALNRLALARNGCGLGLQVCTVLGCGGYGRQNSHNVE